MTTTVDQSQDTLAQRLYDEATAHDGLIPVDLDRFWAENDRAKAEPFANDCPMVPLGPFGPADAVFTELAIEPDFYRYATDAAFRCEINRAYNDKSERIVGRRLLNETPPDPDRQYPQPRMLHDVFEARNEWHSDSWWLMPSANNEDELRALLDRVDERTESLDTLRAFMLPDTWHDAKARLMPQGVKPRLYRGQRGPVTFATSVYGTENLLFLVMDNPNLAERFRDTILRAMLGIAAVLDEEAGYAPDAAPRGFSFADDNCALLNPEMYELFGFRVLKTVFARYAAAPDDWRYQHSDSAMGHLLPILAQMNLSACNFGAS